MLDVDTELPLPCQPFQADGWCDTINNRAYCHYDGGDCCSSTLSSKKVSQGSGTGSGWGSVPGMRAAPWAHSPSCCVLTGVYSAAEKREL